MICEKKKKGRKKSAGPMSDGHSKGFTLGRHPSAESGAWIALTA
jgi:hypothetical protein